MGGKVIEDVLGYVKLQLHAWVGNPCNVVLKIEVENGDVGRIEFSIPEINWTMDKFEKGFWAACKAANIAAIIEADLLEVKVKPEFAN